MAVATYFSAYQYLTSERLLHWIKIFIKHLNSIKISCGGDDFSFSRKAFRLQTVIRESIR